MVELKKIGVLSSGKISALMGVIIGFILGLITALIGGTTSLISGISGFSGLGLIMILIMPILYGILGFLGGIVSAALYNLVARWVGGIELDLINKA